MVKATYDATLCIQKHCPFIKDCYRNLIHYTGERFIYQSMALFKPNEDSCDYFLSSKPWGSRWEDKDE